MKKLTLKQWMVALLVAFLIIGSLGNLALTYFIGLRPVSYTHLTLPTKA